jgi:transposase
LGLRPVPERTSWVAPCAHRAPGAAHPSVKPYRKSNKNDFIDAEAVTKQNMRFVQIKTQEQLDWQAMHRVRDRLMQRCTALINEIRGFLLERGITFPAQPIHLRKNLPTVIEDAEQNTL